MPLSYSILKIFDCYLKVFVFLNSYISSFFILKVIIMLPSTSMVSEVAVVAVQPTSSLASVQLNSSLQDHIVSVASRCASADDIVCERCRRDVSDLQSIAAKSYLRPVQQSENLPRLRHLIDRRQVAQGLKVRLVQTD